MTHHHSTLHLPVTDTHCHLDQYPKDAPGITEEDIETTRIMSMSLNPADFLRFRNENPFPEKIMPALGLFPDPENLTDFALDQLLDHLSETRFVGEIGLDYVSTDEGFLHKQRKAFDRILDRASEKGNAVLSIHSRRASDDIVDRFVGGFPGFPILHWFSGSLESIEKAKGTCFFSINTAMIGSEQGRKRIRAMPEDRLLLESDGPYVLIDENPARPRDLTRVIQFLSGEWACSMEETAARLESNADRIFG